LSNSQTDSQNKLQPHRREAGSAVGSLKQNNAQPALNVAQAAAQGRLADVQSLRRLPEAAVL
jgi:hypothetical protein